jgi:hypothetical protein
LRKLPLNSIFLYLLVDKKVSMRIKYAKYTDLYGPIYEMDSPIALIGIIKEPPTKS